MLEMEQVLIIEKSSYLYNDKWTNWYSAWNKMPNWGKLSLGHQMQT